MKWAIKIVAISLVVILITTNISINAKAVYEVIANAGSDQMADTNELIRFDGSLSVGDQLNLTWNFRDGSKGYGEYPVHSFSEEGIYEVSLLVRDKNNITDIDLVKITVRNQYPSAIAGYDRRVYEDEIVDFDAGGSFDTAMDMKNLIYLWDFGDGGTSTGQKVQHAYTKAGLYYVTLTVEDNDGAVDKDIMTVEVDNIPPIAKAGRDKIVSENDTVVFDASGSSDSPSDKTILSYSWDFGDASVGAGVVTTHIYNRAGTYTVTLTVTDDDGYVSTDSLLVYVRNVRPLAYAGSDMTVKEDQLIFFNGIAKDTVSDLSVLSYFWNFGDGTYGSGQNPVHIFQNEGIYTVTLKVVDDNFDYDTDTLEVTVVNDGPIVDAGPDIEVNEDVIVQFEGRAHDTPSDEQTLKYSWNFGDGNYGTGQNPTHTYTAEGDYTVILTVTDDNSIIGTDTLTVTVKNVPPTAIATYMSPYKVILAGDLITFNAEASDSVSDISKLTYFWDFGDGNTAKGKTVTHAYSTEGIYEVTLSVSDGTSTSTDTLIIIVEKHSFKMTITPGVEVLPGETAEYSITLFNTGTIDDTYELFIDTTIDPSWIDFKETNVLIFADCYEKVKLSITPPRDYPLAYDTLMDFRIVASCTHLPSQVHSAPIKDSVQQTILLIATYESRMIWAQKEVESKIADFAGRNYIDATLLKAVEEISESLFFTRTMESLDFDYVKSFEHVKSGINNLETVTGSVDTKYIIDLLLTSVNDCVEDTIKIAEILALPDNIHVVDAWMIYQNAQNCIASGDYDNGIEQYKSAYTEAVRADGEWVPREYTLMLQTAINNIDGLLSGSYSQNAKTELKSAKADLLEADTTSEHGLLKDSFVDAKSAITHLLNAETQGAPTSVINILITNILGESVKLTIVETETHVGLEVNDIKQAWNNYKQGQTFENDGLYTQAIDKYMRAFSHALLAEDWIPIADAGPDQNCIEDDVLEFDASNSKDRDGIVLFYDWDFGDGCKEHGMMVDHIYKKAGIYHVILLVTDDEGECDIDMMTVTVSNIAPSADISLDYIPRSDSPDKDVVYMDDLVIFEAIYKDTPSDLEGLIFHWDFGDGTSGFGAHTTHIYTAPGNYTVTLTVTDEDGDSGTAIKTIMVKNVAPTASITYSQVAYEDEVVYLTALGYDTPSDIKKLKYKWDFGDGSTGAGQEVTHVYTDEDIYDVTVYVSDGHGGVGTCTVTVSVINPPPEADAGWTIYGFEDSVINFMGKGLDTPSDQLLLTYYWDFGDSSGNSGATQSHTYKTAGIYTVTLTVTDDNGDYDVDFINVIIENVEPTADAGSDTTIDEDSTLTFKGLSSDTTSDLPSLKYHWDFGDNCVGSGSSPAHVYTKSGTYLVTLTVMDDDGAISNDTMTVTVKNPAPQASIVSPKVVDEDELIVFSSNGKDTASDFPLLTYEWDFGDGSKGFGTNPTHLYSDPGKYTVQLMITDDDGATSIDMVDVVVSNVAPEAVAGPDLFIYAERTHIYFLAQGFDTPSDQPSLTYSWDFDDGKTATGFYVSHMYLISGTYVLKLKVTDDDGTVHTDTAIITVIIDSDGDGLSDELERQLGLNPVDIDTDDDGLLDGEEYNYWLTRHNELWPDGVKTTQWSDNDKSGGINLVDPDSDNDGLLDGEEVYKYQTDPAAKDTDLDGLGDGTEVKGWSIGVTLSGVYRTISVKSDPLSKDSDYDGLEDGEEYSSGTDGFKTDPMDSDTDNDGLKDSEEQYEKKFEIEKRYTINDNTEIILLLGTVNMGNVRHATARYGIMHGKVGDLTVKLELKKGSDVKTKVIKNANSGDKSFSLFETVSLFDLGLSSYFSGNWQWYLRVKDGASSNTGNLEFCELNFISRTSPVDDDSDNDQLNDHEEVITGKDGWLTNPTVFDTDGDGLSDGQEVKQKKTDPTNPDTDRDGFNDKVDVDPVSDIVVCFEFKKVRLHKGRDGDGGGKDKEEPFGVVTFYLKSGSAYKEIAIFATTRGKTDGEAAVFNSKYYVDIPDNYRYVYIKAAAWECDSGFRGGDDHIDIDNNQPSGDSKDVDITYDVLTGKWTGDAPSGVAYGDEGDYITFGVSTKKLTKIPTIFLESRKLDDLYLDQYNKYRYLGEDEYYLLLLYVTSSKSPFSGGYNAVIVPRNIFVESKLNSTLQGTSDPTKLPLYLQGLDFSSYDNSKTDNTGSLIAIITGTVTSTNAINILNLLITDKSSKRIADYRIITTQVFTLGISDDVLEQIPSPGFSQSSTGQLPQDWKDKWFKPIVNFFVSVGKFLYQGLLAIGNFFVELGKIIVEIGLKVWGAIKAVAKAVVTAINYVIDLLEKFLEWIIDMIKKMIELIFLPIINGIKNVMLSYGKGVADAMVRGLNDIETKGKLSLDTFMIMNNAFAGKMFWILMGIVAAFYLLMTLLGPYLPLIATLTTIASAFLFGFFIDKLFGNIQNKPQSKDVSNQVNKDTGVGGAAIAAKNHYKNESKVRGTSSRMETDKALGIADLVIGGVSVILTLTSIFIAYKSGGGYGLGWLAIFMGVLGCILSGLTFWYAPIKNFDDKTKLLGGVALVFGFIGIIMGLFEIISTWSLKWYDGFMGGLGILFDCVSVAFAIVALKT
jgi:PKD repeat protein